jgi:hypothetical protein
MRRNMGGLKRDLVAQLLELVGNVRGDDLFVFND